MKLLQIICHVQKNPAGGWHHIWQIIYTNPSLSRWPRSLSRLQGLSTPHCYWFKKRKTGPMCHTLSFQPCLFKGRVSAVSDMGRGSGMYIFMWAANSTSPWTEHWEQCRAWVSRAAVAGVHPRCLQQLIPPAALGMAHTLAEDALALPRQQGKAVQKTPPKLWDHKQGHNQESQSSDTLLHHFSCY